MNAIYSRLAIGRAIAAFLAMALTAAPSTADPINYYFRGTGIGSFAGGAAFTNADFVINLSADTNDIEEFQPGLFDVVGPAVIDVDGVGSATFLVNTRVFDNHSVPALGFSLARPASLDLLDLFDGAFASYSLDTSFGPIVETDPFSSQFVNISTSLGSLTFTSVAVVSFQAVLIPEPLAIIPALSGAAALFWMRRKRSQRI
jgi:hypothetical protein